MILESMTHRYYAICQEEENRAYDIYRCCELNEAVHTAYLVYCVRDEKLIKALAQAFTDKECYENFEEYCECFSTCGILCVVFRYYEQTTLVDKLQDEDCSITERTAIGKKLLQRLLILDMPDFLMSEVMSVEHILLDASLSIHFRYRLEGILLSRRQRAQKIYKGLSDIFTTLFARELALQKCSEIPMFIQRLAAKDFDSGTQELFLVYQEYEVLEEFLDNALGNGTIRPNTFWFRVWDKIKLMVPMIEKLMFCLIVVMIAGYLIYGIVSPQYPEEYLKFNTVGTLRIIKSIEEKETVGATIQQEEG